ncbi:hypothetical protein CBR_g53489 [Chara braunii]|uniref:Reverse transcriptase domain-containing protein n=1 Tax=Chara braunii TaxID=69332 RepID=A0A388MAU1_CHABU|nr:hypothetical protein CBR_g53489 [Chara braunii]|eukprot:GBG91676.1 hypothetical protein CBR_g53489 [Chara braunii]
MVVEGQEVRFKLKTSLDDIKVKWLKERTVTVIYKDAARSLPKNVKDDLVRAFEDGWVLGNEDFSENSRRGRIKIEGPGVASYVAKAREIAEFMISEGQVEVPMGDSSTYKILFKPWMTWANTFWVIATQVPLDDMPFIYAQIEKAIGKIILAHPTDADPSRPALVNARFELDPDSRANMKDVIWVETAKGDVLEIRLATSDTMKCNECKQFFHQEQDCRRRGRPRNQGTNALASAGRQEQNWQATTSSGDALSELRIRLPKDKKLDSAYVRTTLTQDWLVRLPIQGRLDLDRPVTAEEAGEALKDMASGKTPGNDGLPVEFYRQQWSILGDDLVAIYNEIQMGGQLPASACKGIISILYKEGDTNEIRNGARSPCKMSPIRSWLK